VKQLTVILDDHEKREIRERADDADTSMSDWAATAVRQRLADQSAREISAETRVEEAMQEIVALGKDEIRRTARQIAGMNARMGVYSIANWELIKREHADAKRRDALSVGSRRLRKSVDASIADELGVDPDALADDLADLDDDTADDDDPAFDLADRDGDRRERVERGGQNVR
jgi:hypothetical protein